MTKEEIKIVLDMSKRTVTINLPEDYLEELKTRAKDDPEWTIVRLLITDLWLTQLMGKIEVI